MKRRLVQIACAMILLLWPSLSYGQPESVPLLKNEPAPFRCICTDPESQRLITEKAHQCNERTAAEVSKAARLLEVDVDTCLRQRALEDEVTATKLGILQRELEARQAWYRDPLFVVPATVILTTALLVVARETVIEVR